MQTFSISLTNEDLKDEKKMDSIQEFMDKVAEETNKEIVRVAQEFGISDFAAMDVVYLRTRSRWTPELERKLIEEHKNGVEINICEWPNNG